MNDPMKLILGEHSFALHMRNCTDKWRDNSMKFSDFRCCLTSNIVDDVHHLRSYNQILKEFTKVKNMNFDEAFALSYKEIKKLKEEFTDFHNSFGLGLALCQELHVLFHSEYTYSENTYEQFREFVLKLQQGAYNKYLEENEIDLNFDNEVLDYILNSTIIPFDAIRKHSNYIEEQDELSIHKKIKLYNHESSQTINFEKLVIINKVGDILKKIKTERGIYASTIASRLGVSKQSLDSIKKHSTLNITTLIKLSIAMEVDINELFDYKFAE